MSIEKLRPSFTFTEDRLRELQQVVPEAFADGKINWDTLREALGEHLENEEQEHFGLTWPGKREARRLAAMPSKGTLVPVPGEGINEEKTHNLFIEGENLEVLKLMQKSYAKHIKLIYIDPPYNTGHDFVYYDDYIEPLKSYLSKTGEIDKSGKLLTTNNRASGRFHTNWLNMIYPRLLLGKQLLADDGFICVSIDNNELHNLRIIMNEIFGEENFIGIIVRATGTTTGQDSARLGGSFDYLMIYSGSEETVISGIPLDEKDEKRFSEEDENGKYSLLLLRKTGNNDRREDRPLMYYPINTPDGSSVYPIGPSGYESCWRFGKSTYSQYEKQKLIIWKEREKNGVKGWIPYVKYYLEGREKRPSSLWINIDGNKKATHEIKELLGDKVFDNPKPVQFIEKILEITTENDTADIILDFFAGSCTTAHGVISQNLRTNGNRRFICIQMPQPISSDTIAFRLGFRNIAQIGLKRIKAEISKVKTQSPLETVVDLGVQVYRLENSQIHFQEESTETTIPEIQSFFDSQESILPIDVNFKNLLTEILLLQGFPIDSTISALPAFHLNTIQEVTHEFCAHKLNICLDEKIADTTVEAISIQPEDIFVCLDTALTDEAKLRLSDRCQLKVI